MSSPAATILVVDDELKNCKLLEAMLRPEGYLTLTAANGEEALASIAEQAPDLILLDIMMPGMDGYQVASTLKADPATANIPIIMVTALDDAKARLAGLDAGAEDFLSKPVDRAELWLRVRNLLRLKALSDLLEEHGVLLEQQVRERTADLKQSYIETILTMTRAAEYKDEDTGAHVQRISYYSRDLARMLDLDEVFVEEIFLASPMHDVGKIGIPDHILLKPGGFLPDEWEIMKTHAAIGAKILGNSKSPHLMMGAMSALNHHERWDGGGYPNGKRGEDIPLAARIMNICDIYDALRSKRPYKPAFDHQKAMDIITRGDGRTQPSHFDPAILAVFEKNHEAFRETFETYTE
jgi:putative two-component system response regulator